MENFNVRDYNKYSDPKYKIMELKGEELDLAIARMSRLEIIEWLQWNDGNGIYTDKLSMKEFGNIMSREEGVETMTRLILEA